MQWWAWIAVGGILLGSELAFVDAQFYFVFVGAAALVVGVLTALGIAAAPWLQWLIFAALAAFSMGFFRRRIYERMRRSLPSLKAGPAGETVVLNESLSPGGTSRIEYRGSSWGVINAGHEPIKAGGRARIERVDGLTLVLRADPPAQT